MNKMSEADKFLSVRLTFASGSIPLIDAIFDTGEFTISPRRSFVVDTVIDDLLKSSSEKFGLCTNSLLGTSERVVNLISSDFSNQ